MVNSAVVDSRSWKHLKVTRFGCVAELLLHSDGGPLEWNARAGFELTQFFGALAGDAHTRILILTGAGEAFCETSVTFDFHKLPWRDVWAGQQRMLARLIDLNLIVIAAVNGPVLFHPEIPLLCDIVIACPEAEFAELGHVPRGMVPGDGAQLVMAGRLGSSRRNYFYLTSEHIGADEGRRLGFVHEIHPRTALLARAHEIAEGLAKRPAAALAFTKAALRLRERRHFHQELSMGMALEGNALYALGLSGPETRLR